MCEILNNERTNRVSLRRRSNRIKNESTIKLRQKNYSFIYLVLFCRILQRVSLAWQHKIYSSTETGYFSGSSAGATIYKATDKLFLPGIFFFFGFKT